MPPSPLLAILTCDGRQTLARRLVSNLEEIGGAASVAPGRKWIVFDGPGELPRVREPGWDVVRLFKGATDQRPMSLSGTTAATWGVFAAAADAGASRLLFLEDDVVPCRHAITAMVRLELPSHLAFVVCCDLIGYGGLLPALLEVRADLPHWGNQALIIPGETLAGLVRAGVPEDFERNASDVLLHRLAPLFGVVAPSLFDHIGETSIATPGATLVTRGRRPRNWTPGFDALSLRLAGRYR